MTDNKKEAERIVSELQIFSQNGLKRREDLLRILEYGLLEEKKDLLRKIAFNAKFLQGLMQIIRRRDSLLDEKLITLYSTESAASMAELKELIILILEGESDFIAGIFEEKYFRLDSQAINNLYELIDDLSWLKKYQNYAT